MVTSEWAQWYGGREGPFQTQDSFISKVDISKLDLVISKLDFDRGTCTHARWYACHVISCHVTNTMHPVIHRWLWLCVWWFHDERDRAVTFYSRAYFARQLRSSLEGFPYPRLLSSRIPVQAHIIVFSAFRSWDIVIIETIKADFKETRAKKTTPGHELAKRDN